MLEAPSEIREQLAAEVADGHMRAFSDTKTLFLATRPS